MAKTTILGVLLKKRTVTSTEFQSILSKYGCSIKTRVGIHQATDGVCSPDGVILLDIIGEDSELNTLEAELKAIDGAEVQKMVFEL